MVSGPQEIPTNVVEKIGLHVKANGVAYVNQVAKTWRWRHFAMDLKGIIGLEPHVSGYRCRDASGLAPEVWTANFAYPHDSTEVL